MSGYGYREAVLQLDAALWRKRVIFDAESAEGRAAADAHQVPIELIVVAAARIAGHIARGEVEFCPAPGLVMLQKENAAPHG